MKSTAGRIGAAALLVAGLLFTAGGVASAAPAPTAPAPAAPVPAAAAPTLVNNWSCRPSAKHPRPVVLVHGLGANATINFATLAPRLRAAGYCVFAETYGTLAYGPTVGGVAPLATSAEQVGRFVDRVRAATGSAKVDIVGHSAGTTVPAYWMKHLGGASKVDKFVGFGSNFRGTTLNGLSVLAQELRLDPGILALAGCPGCRDFVPGSEFLTKLNSGGSVVVDGPSYTSIVSRFDRVVTPYTNGLLDDPRGTDIVLQDVCRLDLAGHLAQAVDPNVASLILNALSPETATPVRCVPFVAPV